MSEFTQHKIARIEKLLELFTIVIREEFKSDKLQEYQSVIDNCIPADIIDVVDILVIQKTPMPELKKGINKTLNLLNKSLNNYPFSKPKSGSLNDLFFRNNKEAEIRLTEIKPLIKQLNKEPENQNLKTLLVEKLSDLSKIDLHYQIKENVLFPLIEKFMPDYRCLQVMWSFHDDIRRNLKEIIGNLEKQDFDLKRFNNLAGDIFFNIYAIIFREDKILLPVVSELISEDILNGLIPECQKIGFPFIENINTEEYKEESQVLPENEVSLGTGILSVEQIKLIFNHLPVDITYVDENNKVKYFSTPEKRIFRRTNSIIGRDLKNCHPHESVHVVEQIVEAFRNGKESKASFWIQMKGEFILIQYFAVRDEEGNYKGIIEVSQEITEIRNITGEKRLLDWIS